MNNSSVTQNTSSVTDGPGMAGAGEEAPTPALPVGPEQTIEPDPGVDAERITQSGLIIDPERIIDANLLQEPAAGIVTAPATPGAKPGEDRAVVDRAPGVQEKGVEQKANIWKEGLVKNAPSNKKLPNEGSSNAVLLTAGAATEGQYAGKQLHNNAAPKVKAKAPKPYMYLAIFGLWVLALIWFDPRLFSLLKMAHNWKESLALGFFVAFVNIAWLYGLYNTCIVLFAGYYRLMRKIGKSRSPDGKRPAAGDTAGNRLPPGALETKQYPAVALLYTTCNDFVEESVRSCVKQDYPAYTVYILDDSSDESMKQKVDVFAAQYPGLVKVVRRPDRKGFKAGNINHGLETAAAGEPYFAIADADEVLPPDFLRKIVPVLENDPSCGFVQANHRSNPMDEGKLSKDVGPGIDVHWKYYQPLRNEYGFVMFLGHGAVLRRSCWEQVGGFPDIVSEDLGYAISIREHGYRGRFIEDVICYESFPETVRAFRVRHMKWTRGTSEFLTKMMGGLIRAKNISLTEKLDILFPTCNLPLTLVYFLFMLNANIILQALFSHTTTITWLYGGKEFKAPIRMLRQGFEVIYGVDFYIITVLTFLSPILCFIFAFFNKPVKLYRFLSHSTALYASLTPLSSVGVLAYLLTRRAEFLVTGEREGKNEKLMRAGLAPDKSFLHPLRKKWVQLLNRTHPDMLFVQGFEIAIGLIFAYLSFRTFQLSCLGLSLSFIILPLLHHVRWGHPVMRVLVYIPFLLILIGIAMMTFSVFGVQSVFFGYGFHF